MARKQFVLTPLDDGPRDKCMNWGIRISVGYDSRTGKRLRPYETFEGSEYQAERRAMSIRVEHGTSTPTGAMSVEEYFNEMWLPHLRERVASGDLRLTTYRGYETAVNCHILPLFGRQEINELNSYYVEKKIAGIPTPGGRQNAYKTLRQGLRRAKKWRIVTDVVTDYIDQPRLPRHEKTVIKSGDMRSYIDLFSGSKIEAAVIIAFADGPRRSEIAALDGEDFDWAVRGDGFLGEVSITKSCHCVKGEIVIQPPKTYMSYRKFVLPIWAGKRLLGLVPQVGPMLVENDHRMNPDRISRIWKRTIDDENERRGAAGETQIPYIPFKNLRHSCGTMLVQEAKLPITDVQQLLGHDNVMTTSKMYIQRGEDAVRRAAVAMSAMAV